MDLEDYVNRPDKISAAEISSICQEAGMQAVRKNRYIFIVIFVTVVVIGDDDCDDDCGVV